LYKFHATVGYDYARPLIYYEIFFPQLNITFRYKQDDKLLAVPD